MRSKPRTNSELFIAIQETANIKVRDDRTVKVLTSV